MAFRVEITEAQDDASSLLGWLLSQDDRDAGLRWFLALDEAIGTLANFPRRCPLAPENREFPFEVRQLLYGRKPHVYRILFTIETETVHMLHIRHGRRKRLGG